MAELTEKELLGEYKLVLGFEIHVQPKTEKKMFCGCSADIWGAEPNTHTCPTCLGLPGALPVPNLEAVKKTQMFGLALNCTLNENSRFDRKHYFYPDLPKGYQISQYQQPLCENGYLKLASGLRAEIERIHLEEDVAKSIHEGQRTLIDYNKSSLPLMELVTRPVFNNLTDAVDFCKQVQNTVRYLGISEADMEKGQMRLEANVSIRTSAMEAANELPDYKVELKNINSFRFMEKAVKAEIKRQRELLEKSEQPKQETRGFVEEKGITVSQRDKEEAHDYRYFPEPDIPPMHFDENYIAELKNNLPTTPAAYYKKLVEIYKISENSAKMLVDAFGAESILEFEKLVAGGKDAQKVANAIVNKKDLTTLNEEIVGLPEAAIKILAQKAIDANPKAVVDYKAGKQNSLMFLVGVVMRESKGKIVATELKDLLIKLLS